MRSTRFVVSVIICLGLLSTRTLLAQATLDCASLATQALIELGNQCSTLSDGMLCYGHPSLTLEGVQSDSAFSAAGDHAAFETGGHLSGSAANLSSGEWGLALAKTLPTDAATSTYVLSMGDASVELVGNEATSLQIGTGFEPLACNETPSLVVIETSQAASVPLKINGAAVHVQSLVLFQQESANAIKAIVYGGTFSIDGGANAITGQTLAGVMDNKGTILFWSAPRPSSSAEAAAAAVAAKAFTQLGITEPTPVPPPPTSTAVPPTAEPAASVSCGEHVTHVVQPGENLFRIALRYGTSIGAIQQANGIADANQIVVGQSLVIPCGVDSGNSSVAPNGDAPEPTAAPGEPTAAPALPTPQTIDCSGFNGQLPPNAPPAFQQLFNQFCNH